MTGEFYLDIVTKTLITKVSEELLAGMKEQMSGYIKTLLQSELPKIVTNSFKSEADSLKHSVKGSLSEISKRIEHVSDSTEDNFLRVLPKIEETAQLLKSESNKELADDLENRLTTVLKAEIALKTDEIKESGFDNDREKRLMDFLTEEMAEIKELFNRKDEEQRELFNSFTEMTKQQTLAVKDTAEKLKTDIKKELSVLNDGVGLIMKKPLERMEKALNDFPDTFLEKKEIIEEVRSEISSLKPIIEEQGVKWNFSVSNTLIKEVSLLEQRLDEKLQNSLKSEESQKETLQNEQKSLREFIANSYKSHNDLLNTIMHENLTELTKQVNISAGKTEKVGIEIKESIQKGIEGSMKDLTKCIEDNFKGNSKACDSRYESTKSMLNTTEEKLAELFNSMESFHMTLSGLLPEIENKTVTPIKEAVKETDQALNDRFETFRVEEREKTKALEKEIASLKELTENSAQVQSESIVVVTNELADLKERADRNIEKNSANNELISEIQKHQDSGLSDVGQRVEKLLTTINDRLDAAEEKQKEIKNETLSQLKTFAKDNAEKMLHEVSEGNEGVKGDIAEIKQSIHDAGEEQSDKMSAMVASLEKLLTSKEEETDRDHSLFQAVNDFKNEFHLYAEEQIEVETRQNDFINRVVEDQLKNRLEDIKKSIDTINTKIADKDNSTELQIRQLLAEAGSTIEESLKIQQSIENRQRETMRELIEKQAAGLTNKIDSTVTALTREITFFGKETTKILIRTGDELRNFFVHNSDGKYVGLYDR